MSSKNKYKTEGPNTTSVPGESRQRDHTKSGKQARREENRRLEAIARQMRRIQTIELALKGEKVSEAITKYISTFEKPELALKHASLTVQKLRGGISHSKLTMKAEIDVSVVEAPKDEKPKSKYKKRKAAAVQKTDEGGGTTPMPAQMTP